MKPSEMLIELLTNGYYNPETSKYSFMCIALRMYYGPVYEKEVNAAVHEIMNAMKCEFTSLENYLFWYKGIARTNYQARYDFFLELAAKLEREGK